MNILVTGGSGGLGAAVCKALADRGDTVFVCDLTPPKSQSDQLVYIYTDLTDSASIGHCKAEVEKHISCLDAVINLAGVFKMDSIIEGGETDFRNIFEINFWGSYRIFKTFFPILSPKGKFIIMSSELAALSPPPFTGYYSIPKHAVDVYADVLRKECNYLGLKIIKIQAGSFKTNMLKNAASDYDRLLSQTMYFQRPLMIFKKLMTDELQKTNDPKQFAKLLVKILDTKHPKAIYHIKNSLKLKLLNILPADLQDRIYLSVTK
ncbi:MAG TPA: SDR family NAD(P)-dependent oxidoreductase [Oscillospiraceae bacterium]|nr:SDR family NAD(P)-dependent oxidoreductase [Oscillospiraceae bacterium]HPF55464.1 SDR family NAD(P)-dependent oxidoreductase [Clostridiales bacterium]HPK34298.1 SDR family NAD(P)-dependent oxidoreductase [Oscillospiraceae bacterium]HPR74799.1 SDR family NAD(P)-dependent oxidoreductase [Oscillospiraceae bacterium]